MYILYIDIPLWTHVITFVVSWCICSFVRGFSMSVNIQKTLMYLIVFGYSMAILRASIYGSTYPPIEVTMLVGASAGLFDGNIGKFFKDFLDSRNGK